MQQVRTLLQLIRTAVTFGINLQRSMRITQRGGNLLTYYMKRI